MEEKETEEVVTEVKEEAIEETKVVEEEKVIEPKEEKNKEKVKEEKNSKKKKRVLPILLIVFSIAIILLGGYLIYDGICNKDNSKNNGKKSSNNSIDRKLDYACRMSGNGLEFFDLAFLKLEAKEGNVAYSPLSIKYALSMLSAGAKGETKKQIDDVIGDYISPKYANSKNMIFANSIFINNTYKDDVKDEYIKTLKDKYNAEVVFDSFKSVNNINNWVKNKTFNLIDKVYDEGTDLRDYTFLLNNALSIDMEWVNKIQNQYKDYAVGFAHEYGGVWISRFEGHGYSEINFNTDDDKENFVQCMSIDRDKSCDNDKNVINRPRYDAVELAAVAHRYDIIKDLGEDSIRKTVTDAANKWMDEHNGNLMVGELSKDENGRDNIDEYLDKYYLKEISKNYGHISSSTDFRFYIDEDVKMFAKELKEYNGTTLEYIGIMPRKEKLKDYVANIDTNKINTLIGKLKDTSINSFEDGYLTILTGYIPRFKMDYKLDLISDLKAMGIVDVFDENKSDLSGIVKSESNFINSAIHKTAIEFSNDGIKAASTTTYGGAGDLTYKFDYIYEVPTKKIDLTFDNPFLYLIRDKKTGEVWFMGTVYEPVVATHDQDDE